MRKTGEYIVSTTSGETFKAFVPYPLPPEPPVEIDNDIWDLIEKSNRALGRLDGVTTLLPSTYLFTYMYVRKEAVLSSQIEGTQSTLQQLLLFETTEVPGVPINDVQEVSSYVRAMDFGLANIRGEKGLPLSLRLLREVHKVLMANGRGSKSTPGEFRKSQNWLGGTRPGNAVFVGPPVDKLSECLSDFEKFLHDDKVRMPVLLKAALAHVQFETIHPFLDGNGRLGRLLITLLLCSENALSEPMLYLSLFFKANRKEYYQRLQDVREKGDWEGWLRFFLTGVLQTANKAVLAAQSILGLFDEDRRRIAILGQSANSALRVQEILQRRPIATVGWIAKELSLSNPTVYTAIRNLEKLGVVREVTGLNRNQIFSYNAYVSILDEGTTPIKQDE